MATCPAPHGSPSPSDVLLVLLSGLVLLATAFTLGGLAAHPFAG